MAKTLNDLLSYVESDDQRFLVYKPEPNFTRLMCVTLPDDKGGRRPVGLTFASSHVPIPTGTELDEASIHDETLSPHLVVEVNTPKQALAVASAFAKLADRMNAYNNQTEGASNEEECQKD